MGYKSILVPLEESDVLPSVLATTLLVARQFESYIEGLCVRPSLAGAIAVGFEGGVAALAGTEEQFEQEQETRTRRLQEQFDGFVRDKRFLILDNDSLFTARFERILKDASVATVRTAYRAPDMNSIAERWVLSVKSECLNRTILFGERSLLNALHQYCEHYILDRPHQSLHNEPLTEDPTVGSLTGEVVESERLGGLLRSYRRAA